MSRGRTPSVRALRDADPRAVVVELAVVVAVLVGFGAYVNLTDAVVRPAKDLAEASLGVDRHLAGTAVRGALVITGLGAAAAVTASARDLEFPLSVPDRDAADLVAVASLGAAVLAAIQLLPAALRYGVATEHVAAAVANLPADLADRTLIFLLVFAAGMAVLYHGLVQGLVRRAVGREREIAATALLSAYFVTPRFGPSLGAIRGGPWLDVSGTRAAVAVIVVVTLAVVVFAAERLDDPRVRAAAAAPVSLAVALAMVSVWQGIELPWEPLAVAARIALVGVAAYVYADTESLLAPALVYGSYALVSLLARSVALYSLLGG